MMNHSGKEVPPARAKPRDGAKVAGVIVETEKLSKQYGQLAALAECTLTIEPGEVFGLLGPNGAGKTTLLRMLIGQEQPDVGELKFGKTVELGYVEDR